MRGALRLACLVRTPERTPARRLDPPLPSSFYLLKPYPTQPQKLRVDWAAEHLLVALQRLEEALDEYYGYGHGSSSSPSSLAFAGLELVVMQVRRRIAGVLIWQSMAQGFSS